MSLVSKSKPNQIVPVKLAEYFTGVPYSGSVTTLRSAQSHPLKTPYLMSHHNPSTMSTDYSQETSACKQAYVSFHHRDTYHPHHPLPPPLPKPTKDKPQRPIQRPMPYPHPQPDPMPHPKPSPMPYPCPKDDPHPIPYPYPYPYPMPYPLYPL